MSDINHLGPRYPPNRLSRANSQDVEDMILAVVEDQMNYSSLEEWFKKRLTR